jgi:hypothetical protein
MKLLKHKFIAIALVCSGLTGLEAQKVNVDITRIGSYEIEVDGVEEELWDDVDPVNFFLIFGTEQPTVTAYWKALFDNEYIYVLINVEDNDHYPAWESGGNDWDYDKPEIYFDVNDTLVDGAGPSLAGSGHYQFSPGFDQDGYGELHEADGTTQAPGGKYAYVLTGEGYVYENAVAMSSMSNKDGAALTCGKLIGFDATVIDQDEGLTTFRQRMVWQSGDGDEPEAWNNMDACGTISMIGCPVCCDNGINEIKTVGVAVYPNPVTDLLTINADFDRVVINNILGQEISIINQVRTNKLDVGYLLKGIYFLKVYNGERYIGDARILKN